MGVVVCDLVCVPQYKQMTSSLRFEYGNSSFPLRPDADQATILSLLAGLINRSYDQPRLVQDMRAYFNLPTPLELRMFDEILTRAVVFPPSQNPLEVTRQGNEIRVMSTEAMRFGGSPHLLCTFE